MPMEFYSGGLLKYVRNQEYPSAVIKVRTLYDSTEADEKTRSRAAQIFARSRRVLKKLEGLLLQPEEYGSKADLMSEDEMTVLVLGALLYGVGELCDLKKNPEIRTLAEKKYGAKFAQSFSAADGEKGNQMNWDELQDLKRNRAALTAAYLQTGFEHPDSCRQGETLAGIPEELRKSLIMVCSYQDLNKFSVCPERLPDSSIRTRLLAALLHFGCELDLDSEHASKALLESFGMEWVNPGFKYITDHTTVGFNGAEVTLTVALHPDDAARLGEILKEDYISAFFADNEETVKILKEYGISVVLDMKESRIIADRYAKKVPEKELQTILAWSSTQGKMRTILEKIQNQNGGQLPEEIFRFLLDWDKPLDEMNEMLEFLEDQKMLALVLFWGRPDHQLLSLLQELRHKNGGIIPESMMKILSEWDRSEREMKAFLEAVLPSHFFIHKDRLQNRLFALSTNGHYRVLVWNLEEQGYAPVARLGGVDEEISNLRVLRIKDQVLVAGQGTKTVYIWELTHPSGNTDARYMLSASGQVNGYGIGKSAAGNLYAMASTAMGLEIWDLEDARRSTAVPCPELGEEVLLVLNSGLSNNTYQMISRTSEIEQTGKHVWRIEESETPMEFHLVPSVEIEKMLEGTESVGLETGILATEIRPEGKVLGLLTDQNTILYDVMRGEKLCKINHSSFESLDIRLVDFGDYYYVIEFALWLGSHSSSNKIMTGYKIHKASLEIEKQEFVAEEHLALLGCAPVIGEAGESIYYNQQNSPIIWKMDWESGKAEPFYQLEEGMMAVSMKAE